MGNLGAVKEILRAAGIVASLNFCGFASIAAAESGPVSHGLSSEQFEPAGQTVTLSPITGVPARIDISLSNSSIVSAAVLIQLDQERAVLAPMMRVTERNDAVVFQKSFPTPRNRIIYKFVFKTNSGAAGSSKQYRIDAPCRATGDTAGKQNDPDERSRNLSIEIAVYRACLLYARAVLQAGLSSAEADRPGAGTPGANSSDSEGDDPKMSLDDHGGLYVPERVACELPWRTGQAGESGAAGKRKLQGERDGLRRALINLLPESALNYLTGLERNHGFLNPESPPLSTSLSGEELAYRLGLVNLALGAD